MSDYTQADMTGVLFKNERKQPGEDYPDYQGSVTVKGQKLSIGAWLKKIKSGKNAGKTYMSLAVRPWQNKETKPKTSAPAEPDFTDDDIPF